MLSDQLFLYDEKNIVIFLEFIINVIMKNIIEGLIRDHDVLVTLNNEYFSII